MCGAYGDWIPNSALPILPSQSLYEQGRTLIGKSLALAEFVSSWIAWSPHAWCHKRLWYVYLPLSLRSLHSKETKTQQEDHLPLISSFSKNAFRGVKVKTRAKPTQVPVVEMSTGACQLWGGERALGLGDHMRWKRSSTTRKRHILIPQSKAVRRAFSLTFSCTCACAAPPRALMENVINVPWLHIISFSFFHPRELVFDMIVILSINKKARE